MDLLQQFNQELQSIHPPISKQKMMKITKLAIKNIKLYKHIVQSVEKYISKCPNSLKLSSLYVIDAIVRQSIYRLKDKDVYAARFARNFNQTFQYIFHSVPTNDKPKIVRVLNLWQRNGVFNAETIQPLLDLPNKNSLAPIEPQAMSADSPQTPLNQNPDESNMLLIQQIANTLALVKGANENQRSNYDHGRNINNNSQGLGTSSSQGRFNKRLMDYEYDDDDGANGDETPTEAEPPLSTTLSKIEMEHRSKNEYSNANSESRQDSIQHQNQMSNVAQNILSMPAILERWQKLQAQHLIVDDQNQNRLDFTEDKPLEIAKVDSKTNRGHDEFSSQYGSHERSRRARSRSRSPSSSARHKNRYSNRDNEPKSRSASPSAKRSRSHRSRSKSPSRANGNISGLDDRRRRGLPDMRRNCLTICSTTLWLGHVPKTVSEADISDAFGEFGTITSIDLIPPRGCAYVCMDRRQDAFKALNDLGLLRLSGSLIKMAWAPGKGLKDKEFKDYWEVNVGASFIPYSRLRSDLDIDTLEEGGVIDEDTMTDELKKMKAQKEREREEQSKIASDQLANILPVTIGSLNIPSQIPPPFPIPPNLTVPPPSLTNIPLPSLHRGLVIGESLNENGDRDNRITEQTSYTENSLSPGKEKVSMPITLPPMSIPPPPIFSHAPPPFGLPPPPIQGQSSIPLPMFQNPPPSIGQIPGLPFSTQSNHVEETDNEDVIDHQQSDRNLHQQAEYEEQEDRQNQREESFQQQNQDDQITQSQNNQHQTTSLMHPHMSFPTNPTMIPQDDSFNYQMMAGIRPMLHQNMMIHPQQQQPFCDYEQHGPPAQGRLLPVSEDNNLPHEYMTNQTNALYDFNCNPVQNGPQPGFGSMQFGFDEFRFNGSPNGVNLWNGPPRPPAFTPRHVQRARFRNNGRGRGR